MRVAIVTESFLPTLNGVTTSVLRILDQLDARGHQAVVVAPSTTRAERDRLPADYRGFPVVAVPSITLRQFRVGLPTPDLVPLLREIEPDVVHVASPFMVGASGLAAARTLARPSVAVYQTDVPSYLAQHAGALGEVTSRAAWRWVRRVHGMADLTLAPSTAALHDLRAHGVPRTRLWGRGVDTDLYHPARATAPASVALRARLAPDGQRLIGYVGRLAPEKELHRLRGLLDLPGSRLVLVGDGPSRRELGSALPGAAFLGALSGVDLAHAYAALDLFVHTGTRETFGQTLQEAAATGLPVLAPARGGPLDLVLPGVTGDLFDPENPDDLRRRALALLDAGRTSRAALGAAGRDRTLGRSWGALVDVLLGEYESLRTHAPTRA